MPKRCSARKMCCSVAKVSIAGTNVAEGGLGHMDEVAQVSVSIVVVLGFLQLGLSEPF